MSGEPLPSRSESKHPDGSDKLTREEWLRELECGDLIYLTPPMARELAGYLRSNASETAKPATEGQLLEALRPAVSEIFNHFDEMTRGRALQLLINSLRDLDAPSVVASTERKMSPDLVALQAFVDALPQMSDNELVAFANYIEDRGLETIWKRFMARMIAGPSASSSWERKT